MTRTARQKRLRKLRRYTCSHLNKIIYDNPGEAIRAALRRSSSRGMPFKMYLCPLEGANHFHIAKGKIHDKAA